MEEYPGQTPGQPAPPPPNYEPSAAPPPPPPAQYAPPPAQPAAAPPAAPPRKKKTWLWIVLGIVVLGLLGCCAAVVLGGGALFGFLSGPAESIEAMNQATLDGDEDEFDKYVDVESIAAYAYEATIEWVKDTPDYEGLVAEVGEDEAERLLREEYPQEQFIADVADSFSMDSLEGDEFFPNHEVTSTEVDNDTAELVVTATDEGDELEFILGFAYEDYDGEKVWRLKEIKNIIELVEDGGFLE